MRGLSSAILAVLLALPTISNALPQTAVKGIDGYMDPLTGKFTPRPEASTDAATTQIGGTVKINIKAKLVSSIPTSEKIYCDAQLTVYGDTINQANVYQQLATRSGATATCDITVPYLFTVSGSSNTLTISYSVETANEYQAGTSYQFSGSKGPALPANGVTTTVTVPASL